MKAASADCPSALRGERVLGGDRHEGAPMMVSARVVKTHSDRPRRGRTGKANSTPSLRPIQFACMSLDALGPAGQLVERAEQLVGVRVMRM
jgi:hypothetical protein